jgi:phosphatidylglycerol:prolipoprotein diacylglycerol transferase
LAIPLAQAIGRLGCLAAGCCYGKHTASWLGMCLPDANGVWMLRYPTQLMSSAANLLIFVGLLTFERYGTRRSALTATSLVERPGRRGEGWPFDGFLFLLYLSLFCFKRFSIEFLRGDAVSVSGPFTPTHIACLIVFIVSTALMLRGLRSTIPSPQVAGGQDALYRGDLF